MSHPGTLTEEQVNKLNNLFESVVGTNVKELTPISINENESITLYGNEDAFVLNDINHKATTVYREVNIEHTQKNACIRKSIPYWDALNYLNNETLGKFAISAYTNSMLLTATNAVGSIAHRDVKFKYPDNQYVRQLSNGDLEIRLVVSKPL